jgi:hypothetical protein
LRSAGNTYQENTPWRLDTDTLEELGMSQRKLDQLPNLSHLLPASSDIVVTDLVQVSFLVLTVQWLAFAVNDGVLRHNAVVRRIQLDDLELHLSHATAHCEEIAHPYWAVGLQEVRLEVDIEQRTGEALDGVGNGEDCDALGLVTVRACFGCPF